MTFVFFKTVNFDKMAIYDGIDGVLFSSLEKVRLLALLGDMKLQV